MGSSFSGRRAAGCSRSSTRQPRSSSDHPRPAPALGLRAISGVPLEELFAYAVALVQSALLVDFVYVVQLRSDHEVVVRAHVGRKDMNPVGRIVEADRSIASYVIRTGQPVVT